MPPAARVGDMHVCTKIEPGPVPHVGGPLLPNGGETVLIANMIPALAGCQAVCVGPPDSFQNGESSVLIDHKHPLRLGDQSEHGGVIVMGAPTVLIGTPSQGSALAGAASNGTALCKECG